MPKTKVGFEALEPYLPKGSLQPVLDYIHAHRITLTITQKRKSVLGDYRHAHGAKGHRISVNGDLNPFAFLITFLHEVAHLLTFERFGRKVQPHGREWKQAFGEILRRFIAQKIFPADIETALRSSLNNPAASSCADEALLRVLKAHDVRTAPLLFIEDLSAGEEFKTADGRVFKRGDRVRKRYKCVESATGKLYLFSPVYEVKKLPVADGGTSFKPPLPE